MSEPARTQSEPSRVQIQAARLIKRRADQGLGPQPSTEVLRILKAAESTRITPRPAGA